MPRPFARVGLALAAMWLVGSAQAAAQFPQWSTFPLPYPDGRVLPRGQLRVSFLPSYANYHTLFDTTGLTRPLGADLSADTAAANFLPTIAPVETAVRNLTGNTGYRASMGAAETKLDADIRLFPLDLELGLTDWLTFSIRVPVLKTRVQGVLALDTASSVVGWNQAATASGRAQIEQLLTDLEAGASFVEGRIAAGDYGCPSSTQCANANAAVARARQLRSNLMLLTGVASTGLVPPVAPLASSAAGVAIQTEIAAVKSQLTTFGAPAAGGSLPLPAARVSADTVGAMLADSAFGYGLDPLETIRIYEFGDMEVGLRIGLLRGERVRAALHGTLRLPTGTREASRYVFDAGTGDRQMDLAIGIDAAIESARLGLATTARYTVQMADNLTARLTPPERPIAPAAWELPYQRNLGDVLQLAAYPSVRLSAGFRAYGSVYFFRKGADAYTGGLTDADPLGGPPIDLSRATAHRALSFGGGVHYRSERGRGEATALPIEAGLSYSAAFSGSERTPKSTVLNLYLRLYYRVFGN